MNESGWSKIGVDDAGFLDFRPREDQLLDSAAEDRTAAPSEEVATARSGTVE